MFRKVPHLDDLVFWIGEMHMIMHDDLLTNSWDLDKTRVKLFPNFTRHQLITHIMGDELR